MGNLQGLFNFGGAGLFARMKRLKYVPPVKVTRPGWGLAYGELYSAELPENVIYAFVYVDEYNGYYEIREMP